AGWWRLDAQAMAGSQGDLTLNALDARRSYPVGQWGEAADSRPIIAWLPAGDYQLQSRHRSPVPAELSLTLQALDRQVLPIGAAQTLATTAVDQILELDSTPLAQFELLLQTGDPDAWTLWQLPADGGDPRRLSWQPAPAGDTRQRLSFDQDYHAGPVRLWLQRSGVTTAPLTLQASRTEVAPPVASDGPLVAGVWRDDFNSLDGRTFQVSLAADDLLLFDLQTRYSRDAAWTALTQHAESEGLKPIWQGGRLGEDGLTVFQAEAGEYHYRVYLGGAETGPQNRIRLRRGSEAPILATNRLQTLSLPAEDSQLYRLPLTANARWQWQPRPAAPQGRYTLYDLQGRQLASGRFDEALSRDIPQSGDYLLRLDNPGQSALSLAVQIDHLPLSPALVQPRGLLDPLQTHALRLAFTGDNQRGVIEFDLAQSGLWLAQPLSALAGTDIRLSGPRDTKIPWQVLGESLGSQPLFLEAGHYRLEFDHHAAASLGEAAISLQPLAALPPTAANQPISLSDLAPGASRWLRLDPVAAGQLELGALSDNGEGTLVFGRLEGYRLALYNRAGQALHDGEGGLGSESDMGSRMVDTDWSGPLTLRIEREPAPLDGNGPPPPVAQTFGFRQVRTTPDTATPVQPGQTINWQPAAGDAFAFDLAEDGWLALEWLSGAYQHWQLEGPAGTQEGGEIGAATGWQLPVRWLPAGHYQLRLSEGSGEARFILRTAAQCYPVSVNTPVKITLDANDPYELFAVQLEAGQRLHWLAGEAMGAGNHFRLYDPHGQLLNPVAGTATTDSGPLLDPVPVSGRYLLAISRQATGSLGAASLHFELVQTPAEPPSLPLDQTVSARLLQSGGPLDYRLSLVTAGQIVFDGPDGLQLTLLDAFNRPLAPLQTGRSQDDPQAWALAAGLYTVRLQQPGLRAGSTIALTSRRLETRSLAVAGQTTLHWQQGVADAVLDLDLQAGQRYWFAAAGPMAWGQRHDWRLIGPDGQIAQQGGFGNDHGLDSGLSLSVRQSGHYQLHLGASDSAGSQTTFHLQTAAVGEQRYVPGSAQSGQLANPAERADYRFSLKQGGPVWLHAVGNAHTLTLRRADTGAVLHSLGDGRNLLNQHRWLDLAAGDYQLSVQTASEAAGRYSWQLQSVADLPVLTAGPVVETQVSEGRQASAWQIAGQAGDTLLLDWHGLSGDSSFQSWALLGPDGQVVVDSYFYGQATSPRMVLPQTGRYLLRLNGDASSVLPRHSSVQLIRVQDSRQPVALGEQISARLASPGAEAHYPLTLTAPTSVLLQAGGGAATLTLQGPDGQSQTLDLAQRGAYRVVTLPAGQWDIRVRAEGLATPDYQFSLSDLTRLATPVSASPALAAGQTLGVWRLPVTAGQRYQLAFPQTLDQARYRLYTPEGRLLLDDQAAASWNRQDFTAPGSEVLLLVNRPQSPQAA
ncbi:hypothetical protein, partial [Parachitinimonas caeni]